jgi:hypothetical protein
MSGMREVREVMENTRRDQLLHRTLELFLRLAVTAQAGKPVPWSLWAIMTAAYNAVQEGLPRAEEFLELAEDVFHKDLSGSMRDCILKMPLPLELARPAVPSELPPDFGSKEEQLDDAADWFSSLFERVSAIMEKQSRIPPSAGTEALFLLLLAINNAVHRGLTVSVPVLCTLKSAWESLDPDERQSLLGLPSRSQELKATRRR